MKDVNVRDLIGIPFKVHGRDKSGMDCYGVVIEFMHRAGIEFPDVFYDRIEGADESVKSTILNGLPVEKIDEPEYGCLVDINLYTGIHVGVYLGGGSFIHATRDMGVCVQKVERFRKAVKGYWRVKGQPQ